MRARWIAYRSYSGSSKAAAATVVAVPADDVEQSSQESHPFLLAPLEP